MPKTGSLWPVLTRYNQDHLDRIALPLGGIGTGTVSLGGRGDLRDWEIVNRPAKGWTPGESRGVGGVFALWTKDSRGRTITRALESAIPEKDYEGASGCPLPNHSLPRFAKSSFLAAYPFGQVLLSDAQVPVDVRIEAFNPLVPADPDASGIPVAILRFVLHNKTASAVDASVCGTLVNFIGADGSPPAGKGWDGSPNFASQMKENRNAFRQEAGLQGVFMYSEGVDKNAEQFGTIALSTPASNGVTYRTAWAEAGWGDSLLDFWDDFSEDGRLEERPRGGVQNPKGSLAVRIKIPARASKAITFLLTWHFPNRKTWTPAPANTQPAAAPAPASSCCSTGGCSTTGATGTLPASALSATARADKPPVAHNPDPNHIGNYYTTRYPRCLGCRRPHRVRLAATGSGHSSLRSRLLRQRPPDGRQGSRAE